MPAPPSPPYPTQNIWGVIRPCGAKWYMPETVTGEIPGEHGAGSDLKVTLQPIATLAVLENLSKDRQTQLDLRTVLEDKIDALREEVDENSGAGGTRRFLTSKEEKSILWLLDHAEVELDAANKIWEKWFNKDFSLSKGDSAQDYHPACAGRAGQTVTIRTGGRPQKIKCPSATQLKQRTSDRQTITARFTWAMMHIRCADFGLNRILLYKQALADFKEIPLPEKVPVPPEGGPKTPFTGPGQFKPPTIDPDACKEVGVGCPPGEEGPGVIFPCPPNFCPDPDSLPDPEGLDDGLPTGEEPKPTKAKKKTYSAGAVATAGVVGAVAVFGVYQLLKPR